MASTAPAYLGLTASLGTSTAQSLYTLLGGTSTQANQPSTPVPLVAREVTIQSPSSNTGVIAVGSAGVSATNRGYDLQVGDSRTYRAAQGEQIYLSMILAFTATASQKLNIEVIQ